MRLGSAPRFIRRPLARFGLFIDPASARVCVCVCVRVALRCVALWLPTNSGQLSPYHLLFFLRSVIREWVVIPLISVNIPKCLRRRPEVNYDLYAISVILIYCGTFIVSFIAECINYYSPVGLATEMGFCGTKILVYIIRTVLRSDFTSGRLLTF